MKIERKHSFSVEEARSRMEALTEYWHSKYGIRPEWSGNIGRAKGKVKGISFDARVDVGPTAVLCDADVGFLAEKLGARAYVEKKLDEYLDPKKPVAELKKG